MIIETSKMLTYYSDSKMHNITNYGEIDLHVLLIFTTH